MGMTLKHPVVPSASPLSRTLDGIRAMEDAGAAAIVMYSLFEEQITLEANILDHYLSYGADSFPEAASYFPEMAHYNIGPDEYLALLTRAKAATDIPIIGSLNGISTGGWIDYARKIEQAGADGLELNVYFIPTDPLLTGEGVETVYLNVLRDVRQNINIPVAMKLIPYFSSIANMSARLSHAGADALVLFNRFYQPDFDLEQLEVVPHLVLSNSHELRLPLHWTAILFGRIKADLAITTGIHTHYDVIKGLLSGANVTMMASELMQHGIGRIGDVVQGLKEWMEDHEYESVHQMRGSMSYLNVAEPAAFERANYMKMLQSWRDDPNSRLPEKVH
jgi:dihydroorotate dehydrogenase (fumarate)